MSVIMNVRNGEAHLREALQSVLAQSFGDWELVVWDDFSTDASAAIVGEFRDPRIRYLMSPQDTPLGHARRLAIGQARGEWLAFLDQDDIWLPDKLDLQVAIAREDSGAALIYGRTVRFTRGGDERDFDHRHEFEPLPEGDLFLRLFTDSCFIAMSSAMLRRSAVDGIDPIPGWVDVIPDYYLYLALAQRHPFRAVQRVVCRYRVHLSSLSQTGGRRMHEEVLRLLDRWAPGLDPELVKRRRLVHSTALAVEEMRQAGLRAAGLGRLLREGSVAYLLSRPLAWMFRGLRRHLVQPVWRRDQGAAVPYSQAQLDPRATLRLSIIVVNWKVRELLKGCLRSLERQMQMPHGDWEVIVADNASDDGSVEMVRAEFSGARLIANAENLGFGRANNQAFHECRGRYVLLLNPDTELLDHAVDRMVARMDALPDVAAIGCRLLNSDGTFQRWTGGNQPSLLTVACHFLLLYRLLPAAILPPPLYLESEPGEETEVGWVSGACMLLRREALGKSIFDERFFMYWEDVELCDRLVHAGWRVIYLPHARILHHEGKSLEHQTREFQMSKVRSLRMVFSMRNGPVALAAYDVIVMIGFLARLAAFSAAALVRPGRGYRARAAASARYLAEAFETLVGRRAGR